VNRIVCIRLELLANGIQCAAATEEKNPWAKRWTIAVSPYPQWVGHLYSTGYVDVIHIRQLS